MYVIYSQVNVLALFNNYQIVLNCTCHFVYSPLTSYVNITTIDYTTILHFINFIGQQNFNLSIEFMIQYLFIIVFNTIAQQSCM